MNNKITTFTWKSGSQILKNNWRHTSNLWSLKVILFGAFSSSLCLFFCLLFIYTHLSFTKISSISVFYESKFAVELPMYEKHLYAIYYFYCNRKFPGNIFWESYKSCLSFTKKRISHFHEGSLLGGDIDRPVLEHHQAHYFASSILSSGKR